MPRFEAGRGGVVLRRSLVHARLEVQVPEGVENELEALVVGMDAVVLHQVIGRVAGQVRVPDGRVGDAACCLYTGEIGERQIQ